MASFDFPQDLSGSLNGILQPAPLPEEVQGQPDEALLEVFQQRFGGGFKWMPEHEKVSLLSVTTLMLAMRKKEEGDDMELPSAGEAWHLIDGEVPPLGEGIIAFFPTLNALSGEGLLELSRALIAQLQAE
jgi:hypothetical protein